MVILAAVDRSEQATDVLAEAEVLASQIGEPLHVIHVMSKAEFIEIETTNVAKENESIEIGRIREMAAEHARSAAASIDRDCEVVGRMGDAKSEIIGYANEIGARYVVIGGRKRSPAGKVIFGSTGQAVLLNADQPVLSVIN